MRRYPEQFIIETDGSVHLPFPQQLRETRNPPRAVTAARPGLLALFSLFTIIKLERKPNWKIVPFQFPCHHVISMKNICGMAKWPVDKTPTLSDVLFSIPLRQNQNSRAAQTKTK